MGGEDTIRTVECLRGRLQAERVASRNAKEDAYLMETKLTELEARLKEENKSRNRAEKRFKHLMKKLESINISLTSSDESENWSLTVGSEDSSASNTACSSSKVSEDTMLQFEAVSSSTDDSQEAIDNAKAENESLSSPGEEDTGKSVEHGFIERKDLPMRDDNSLEVAFEKSEMNGSDREENTDNSLALVRVCLPNPKQTFDIAVLDPTVKDVLDSLRHAKEKLQNMLERQLMI
ncbi:unnamed protein product [Cuscuta epithymum]|uniref:Uncharacterized protein n=1 Tax=Cuscuta epithymum TaxID=186058 RepID=A0AAV0EUY0_9ASTE|nr:unnamed protein product [Cuscuta epithymum]